MTVGADLMSWSGEAAAWIGLLGEAAAKGTLLLLAALLLALALRRGSAASRHLVWASCLGLLLVLPVLAQIAPAVPAPVIPPSWNAAWVSAMDAVSSGLSELLADGSSSRATVTASVIESSNTGEEGAAAGTSVQLTPLDRDDAGGLMTATALTAVWLAGVAFVLVWLAIGLWLRRSLSHRAHVVRSGPWMDAARGIATQLGLRRDLILLRGEDDAVPMTWGNLRPVVYLPPGADGWPAEQLRSVLLHELAHVRRWDSLTRSISQLACAVFWFHPLAWYAAHRLLREQERACDDVVLLAGAVPDEYASTLLNLAQHYRQRRPAVVGALALARRTTLENRLMSILDPRRKRLTMSRSHRVLLLAACVAVALPLALLQPAPAEPLLAMPQSAAASGGQQEATTSTASVKTDPVQMIIKGEVHLGASLDEIDVGPGGRFVIQEIQSIDDHLEIDAAEPNQGRRLEITSDAEGNDERTWSVDGVTQRLDDDARDWIDGILGRIDDAHVEFEPFASDETRTLLFAGDSLAMVGEAHSVAGASSHGVLVITKGDRVIHLKPGMAWTTEEGTTIDLHLSKPHVVEEGTTIDLHLSRPYVVEEGGGWTIHLEDPEGLLHMGEADESIVLKLERAEGGGAFTVLTPELKILREGADRKVIVVVPKGGISKEDLSDIIVKSKVEILEEGDEAHAYIVVEPKIVAKVAVNPSVHVEIVREPYVVIDVRTDEHSEHTITMDIDDDDSHMTVRMRGDVDLGETVDEIEVGEGGELSIDERDADGVVRQVSIRPGPEGDLLFEFFVDGTERPFDAAARAWLERVIERIKT